MIETSNCNNILQKRDLSRFYREGIVKWRDKVGEEQRVGQYHEAARLAKGVVRMHEKHRQQNVVVAEVKDAVLAPRVRREFDAASGERFFHWHCARYFISHGLKRRTRQLLCGIL